MLNLFFFFLQANNTQTVLSIDFFVTSAYGEQLYNSCKDVKFGSLNTRAMDFIGGGAHNYQGKLHMIANSFHFIMSC
jgi:Niemann-Pick C1 protein